jgi:hypothetical protein
VQQRNAEEQRKIEKRGGKRETKGRQKGDKREAKGGKKEDKERRNESNEWRRVLVGVCLARV